MPCICFIVQPWPPVSLAAREEQAERSIKPVRQGSQSLQNGLLATCMAREKPSQLL